MDPLTSEAILGLDVLVQCTVDLLHGHLITGTGHVVNTCMCCQQQSTEWKINLVDDCGCKTLNNNMSTGNSEDVKSTGQLEDVERAGQLENVQLLEGPEDVVHI